MLSVQKKVDTSRADHGVQMLSNLLLKTPLVLRAPVHGGEENYAPRSGHVSQSPEDLGLAIKGMAGTSGSTNHIEWASASMRLHFSQSYIW